MYEASASTPAATERPNLLGQRILAGLIDHAVVVTIFFLLRFAFFNHGAPAETALEPRLPGWPFLVFLLVLLSYYFISEARWGQTIGKGLLGLKVVSIRGDRSSRQIAIRTVLRLVDGFFYYLVGVAAIVLSKRQQRLGDLAAGTTVVRAREEV